MSFAVLKNRTQLWKQPEVGQVWDLRLLRGRERWARKTGQDGEAASTGGFSVSQGEGKEQEESVAGHRVRLVNRKEIKSKERWWQNRLQQFLSLPQPPVGTLAKHCPSWVPTLS